MKSNKQSAKGFIQLHVESDGTALGTFVKDNYGNIVDLITEIKWKVCAENGMSECELKLIRIPADIIAKNTLKRKYTDVIKKK